MDRGHVGDGAFGTVSKMHHPRTNTEMAVKVHVLFHMAEIGLNFDSCTLDLLKKIPIRELRGTDKKDIIELAIVMQSGNCPYIVCFYGCLIRDVSGNPFLVGSVCTESSC